MYLLISTDEEDDELDDIWQRITRVSHSLAEVPCAARRGTAAQPLGVWKGRNAAKGPFDLWPKEFRRPLAGTTAARPPVDRAAGPRGSSEGQESCHRISKRCSGVGRGSSY